MRRKIVLMTIVVIAMSTVAPAAIQWQGGAVGHVAATGTLGVYGVARQNNTSRVGGQQGVVSAGWPNVGASRQRGSVTINNRSYTQSFLGGAVAAFAGGGFFGQLTLY